MVNNASKWELKKLEQVMLDITNGTTQNQIDDPTAYPVTRIETISDGVIDPTRVKYLEEINKNDLIKYRLKKGDILFSHINSIGHIGKTAYYDGKPETLIHGMNLLKLRPNSGVILPKYLFAVTNYELFRNRVKSLAKKAINQASINQKEVGSIYLNVPPLHEQRGIVEFLGTVDECIHLTEAIIEKITELKRGFLYLFFEDSSLTREKIGNVIAIQQGYAFKSEEFSEIGIPVIKIQNVAEPIIDRNLINSFYNKKINKKLERYKIIKGDLLISLTGSKVTQLNSAVGKVSQYTSNEIALLNQRVGKIIISNPNILEKKYLYYFLLAPSIHRYLALRATGSAQQANINNKLIKDLMIPFIDIKEQKNISNLFSCYDEAMNIEKRYKILLINLKKGLMQLLLSGKIRVKIKGDGVHRIVTEALN